MKYAVVMGSGAMIHIPGFTETDSDIQMLIKGIRIDSQIHIYKQQQGDISSKYEK
jgi:hypothetical protein